MLWNRIGGCSKAWTGWLVGTCRRRGRLTMDGKGTCGGDEERGSASVRECHVYGWEVPRALLAFGAGASHEAYLHPNQYLPSSVTVLGMYASIFGWIWIALPLLFTENGFSSFRNLGNRKFPWKIYSASFVYLMERMIMIIFLCLRSHERMIMYGNFYCYFS